MVISEKDLEILTDTVFEELDVIVTDGLITDEETGLLVRYMSGEPLDGLLKELTEVDASEESLDSLQECLDGVIARSLR